jgi:transposase-like protein
MMCAEKTGGFNLVTKHTHQEFTMSKKHKTYTTEFKAEAIKLIEANQGNVSETARQLSISMQTLSNWNTKAKAGTLAGTKQYSPDLNALLEENKKLKQQLKIAEMEREFLKRQQRTLPKKVSKVRLYETKKKIFFSNYLNGSITSCFSFMFL